MRISALYRHPIKAIGWDRVEEAALAPGRSFPGDRMWAVAQTAARAAPGAWSECDNFLRGAKTAALMAVRARLDGRRVTLSHPDRPEWAGHPDDAQDAAALLDWLRPLCDPDRPGPERVVASGPGAMTDSPHQGISVMGEASLAALAEAAGKALSRQRFRGNIWLEGLDPWEEHGWEGRRLALGGAVLEVVEPIERCISTHADTATGRRDTDILGLLRARWGHRNFGIDAVVVTPGPVRLGDAARLL